MSFPAYPSYRESGDEWLGDVPAHWDVGRLSHVSNCSKVQVSPAAMAEQAIFHYSIPAVQRSGDGAPEDGADIDSAKLIITQPQVLVSKLNPRKSTIVVARPRDELTVCSTEFVPLTPTEIDIRFLFHLVSSAGFRQRLEARAESATRSHQRVNPDDIHKAQCAFPPLPEQIAIAAFLDRETAKIDALVEEQRRLIELLREKRQAVISHAVTKGLDPTVPMKDSGVEWLGEVPAHWEVRRLASLFREVVEPGWEALPVLSVSIHDGISDAEIPEHEMDRQVTRSEDRSKYKVVRPNDLVYNMMRAWQGGFGAVTVDGCVSPAYVVARPTAELDTQYIEWLLRTPMMIEEMRRRSVGVADFRLRLYWDEFKDMMVPLPSLAEQQGLVSAIQAEIERFDALSEQASGASSLLQERRAALISAAVTGKIDVRGGAKVLPFPMDRSRARGLVAVEIIERSTDQPTFGRVKFQKIAFLAEAHAGIGELAGSYTREAAGPLDRTLITEMENSAGTIAGVTVDQSGGAGTVVSYRLSQRRGAHRQELADWLEPDRLAKLDKLIADFADLSTKGAEAVATLYAVWNDALIEGALPTDDEIIAGFLNDWHPEKRDKFRADELPAWLDWMRRHGIVPTGNGPKTSTGRLLV